MLFLILTPIFHNIRKKCMFYISDNISDNVDPASSSSSPPDDHPVSVNSFQPLVVLCPSNPCQNGGQCLMVGSSPRCVCQLSHTGSCSFMFCRFGDYHFVVMVTSLKGMGMGFARSGLGFNELQTDLTFRFHGTVLFTYLSNSLSISSN